MNVFKSSKNYLMVTLLWVIIVFLLAIPFTPSTNEDAGVFDFVGFTILYIICALLAWILLDTKYIIKQNELLYRSGPIRGSIKIESILKVEHWNKWYSTSFLKPALGKDGLVIHYGTFDDIYISPKNKEALIAALCEINPDIEIV